MKKSFKIDFHLLLCVAGVIFSLLVSGCGTTTGNALIASEAFNTSGDAIIQSPYFAGFGFSSPLGYAVAPSTNVTEFKLCIKKARLFYSEVATSEHDADDDSQYASFEIGEVDLSTGEAVEWGEIPVAGAFHLERISIRAEKDQTLCPNYNFAMKFNGHRSANSVRLQWQLEPAVLVEAGSTLSLSLSSVVGNLRQASDSNDLSDDNLKDKVEASENKASKKKKK